MIAKITAFDQRTIILSSAMKVWHEYPVLVWKDNAL